MSVVFTKTAKSSANGSFLGALLVASIGGMFLFLLLLKEDLGIVVQTVLGGLVVGCIFWVRTLIREGFRYLRSGRDWRVEITDRKLTWSSPVQEIMRSFEVPFSNIRTLRHVRIRRKTSKGTRYTDKYSIELKNDEVIDLPTNISGINPLPVLDAMHEKGVPLAKDIIRTKEQFRKMREERRTRTVETKVNGLSQHPAQ